MKILIVENEIYLAQSISAKLSEQGYECEVCATVNEAQSKELSFGIVLLSTNISGQNFYPIIEKYRNSIIILMISYVSSDTVANPLKAGAKDYILKPFMIDELLRKIEHYMDYEDVKRKNRLMEKYLDFLLKDIDVDLEERVEFPVFLKASNQKYADRYFFKLVSQKRIKAEIVILGEENLNTFLNGIKRDVVIYALGYENLKKSEKKEFEELFADRKVIIPIVDRVDEMVFNVVEIKGESGSVDISGDILSIDDYVKLIVTKYEDKYPDTELSRKLGMSRKSLWEKRKKYGISKKK